MGLHITWSTGGGFVGTLAMAEHPVYRIQMADPAPPFLRDARSRQQIAHPWARVPGGVFVAEGVETDAGPVLTRQSSPVDELDALIAHATAVDIQQDSALLGFVNRWGLLGLAEPKTGTQQYWDSVPMMRAELERFQHLARWLSAIKQETWSSSAIPPSTELRATIELPVTSRKHRRPALARAAFAKRLNEQMQHVRVHVGLRLRNRRLEPILEPHRLADLLYVTLLHHVGAGGNTVARRCDGCHGLFFVSATNHRRAYCGARCKNTAKVRRWRQRQRDAAEVASAD